MHGNLVTVTQYAEMSGLNKGTVSRLVSNGVIPNHGMPGKPLINPSEADAARLTHLDRSKAGVLSSGGEIKTAGAASSAVPASRDESRASGGFQRARTAREAAQAQMAALDLKERLGELLDKSEVENSIVKVAIEVQRQLEQRVPPLADRLVGITDPARIAALIREADRKVLGEMARAFDEIAKREGVSDAA